MLKIWSNNIFFSFSCLLKTTVCRLSNVILKDREMSRDNQKETTKGPGHLKACKIQKVSCRKLMRVQVTVRKCPTISKVTHRTALLWSERTQLYSNVRDNALAVWHFGFNRSGPGHWCETGLGQLLCRLGSHCLVSWPWHWASVDLKEPGLPSRDPAATGQWQLEKIMTICKFRPIYVKQNNLFGKRYLWVVSTMYYFVAKQAFFWAPGL